MSRSAQPETEAINTDSFLDIVASVVSIMIIMVLMTGLKIQNSPVDPALVAAAVQSVAVPENEPDREQSVKAELTRTSNEIDALRRQAAAKREQCDELAKAVQSLEQKEQAVRQDLDARAKQEAAEIGHRIGDARTYLADLDRKRVAVEMAPSAPIAIESYPTPLSRFVAGHELHFHLRGNRLAFVPMDSLVSKLHDDARVKVDRLRDAPEMTETLEPEQGFLLKYTLERLDKGARSEVRLKYYDLVPTSEELGEPVDQALAPNSKFLQLLRDLQAKNATITIWTYPDSFDAFRRIKKELYGLGFSVAARPLPEGLHIGGSPHGSKSAAE
jgi:hypothetical protein